MHNPGSDETLDVITTPAPVQTGLAKDPPRPWLQINAEYRKETLACRRYLPPSGGEYHVNHGHQRTGNSASTLASHLIVPTWGNADCVVVGWPRLPAGRHLYGGGALDTLQHCRDQRGGDPIIAKAALVSDSQKPRG